MHITFKYKQILYTKMLKTEYIFLLSNAIQILWSWLLLDTDQQFNKEVMQIVLNG